MRLVARDCAPFERQPTAAEAAWLRRLATNVNALDFVIPISTKRDDDEPIVYCDWDGKWWAGRYVGSVSFEGHSLTIKPRFGLTTLRNWISEATSVVLTQAPGRLREDESFIAQLLASVWAHSFVESAKHGLPALRRENAIKGATIKGRLDVAASLRLMATNSGQVVSVRSDRSLDHASSNAIVAAYQVLRRWIGVGDERWLPPRARELLPQMMAVTGAQPRVPTKAQLDRIRYTPITAGFAPVAELSRQIANRRGLAADVNASGETKGILLDVAELWEMYVLSVLRKAATPLTVLHGTRDKSANKVLLYSDVSGKGMGTLMPDAILLSGSTIRGVVDAKYKPLHPSSTSKNGPQSGDLYQMTAYLERFQAPIGLATWGLFTYPLDPRKPELPMAEQDSPWSLETGKMMAFATIPHNPDDAVQKLIALISKMASESSSYASA
jgi:5-methylcytosine-specific restriction enzyme subunit McrC